MMTMQDKRRKAGLMVQDTAWLMGANHVSLCRIETEDPSGYKRFPTLPQRMQLEAVILLSERGLLEEYVHRVLPIVEACRPGKKLPRGIKKLIGALQCT